MKDIAQQPGTYFGMTFLFMLFSFPSLAQKDSTHHSTISCSGYADVYAAYYTDSVGINNYQKYSSVSPRSNQFGLNVAMLTANFNSTYVHSTLTLHYGDFPRSSWSQSFNFIQEANVGVRLCKKLWLDGGFFRTHLGTESAFPKENYTSSLAITTFYEPYYESGFKLSYYPSDNLSIYVLALNGYGIYEDNNKKKSAGLLVTYVFSNKLNIGYSGYYGDDSPEGDSITHLRIYHNAFINFKSKKLKLTAGGDFATQEHSDIIDSKKQAVLWSGVFIADYNVCKNRKFDIYARAEVLNDAQGMVSGVFIDNDNKLTGLKIYGLTLGLQYKPTDNSYIRIEGRELMADNAQKIFRWNNQDANTRYEVMLTMGVWFEIKDKPIN